MALILTCVRVYVDGWSWYEHELVVCVYWICDMGVFDVGVWIGVCADDAYVVLDF